MLTKVAREAKKRLLEELDSKGFLLASRIEKYTVRAKDPNFEKFDGLCDTSRKLYNCINWRCRQAWNEGQDLPNYTTLDSLCKSGEVDYLTEHYRAMPAQVSQQVIIKCLGDWANYFKALRSYGQDSSKFLGKPNPPGYKKRRFQITIPQAFSVTGKVSIEDTYPKNMLSFLKRKGVKPIQLSGKHPSDNIKQIQINPKATTYQVVVIYEMKIRKEPINDLDGSLRRILGIDLGVNNFVAGANNVGLRPFLISGRSIKSINQHYNKAVAQAKKLLPYYTTSDGEQKQSKTSKKIQLLSEQRRLVIDDYFHKITRFLVDYCLENQLDTLVIGYNPLWKQNVSIGKRNNQNFVYIPFRRFIDMLKYKCLDAGIIFKEVTEEYTSKCSFLDKEPLCHHVNYMGRRVKRGMFKSSKGYLINADINGALNILRKVFPTAFDLFEDLRDSGCGLHPVKLSGISRLTMLLKDNSNVDRKILTKMEIKDRRKLEVLKNANRFIHV